jgi:hypothetical protein
VRLYLPEDERDAPVAICSELPADEGSSITYAAVADHSRGDGVLGCRGRWLHQHLTRHFVYLVSRGTTKGVRCATTLGAGKGTMVGLGKASSPTRKPRGEPLGSSRSTYGHHGAGEGRALEVEVQWDARHRGAQVGSSSAPCVGRATGGRAFGTFLVPRTGEGVRGGTHGPSRKVCARASSPCLTCDPTVIGLTPCGLRLACG